MMTIAVEPLTGIDVDSTLPCDAKRVTLDPNDKVLDELDCPNPAVVRLHLVCDCGMEYRNFYCEFHKEIAYSGALYCNGCDQPVATVVTT
jgi:hypothetical protein